MITTSDPKIFESLRMIRNQGMNQQYFHEVLGGNFRMTDLCAAIGVPQLARLPKWNQIRVKNAQFLSAHLQNVLTPKVRDGIEHVFHQYTVRVPASERDRFVSRLNERGVGARVYYARPIHQQPVVLARAPAPVHLPMTEKLAAEVVSLPVHPQLSQEQLQFVVDEVNAC